MHIICKEVYREDIETEEGVVFDEPRWNKINWTHHIDRRGYEKCKMSRAAEDPYCHTMSSSTLIRGMNDIEEGNDELEFQIVEAPLQTVLL